jgi:predicted Zn-dependent peptidase
LGRSLTGTFRSIESISRGQMLQYRSVHYVAANTLVAVAGRIRHEQVLGKVARYAPRFAKGRQPPYQPAACEDRQPSLRSLHKETNQLQLALGFPVCSRHDDRRFPLRLLNTLLGENMSSRLFQTLREDHGLAYSIHSSLNLFDDVGALVISAGLDPRHLFNALKLIARELRRCRERPPTASEVRQARDYLIGQLDLNLESSDSQMTWIGEHVLAYRRIIPPQQIKQRLKETTPGELRKVASEFLRPDRVHLALVSSRKKEEPLLQRLRF